jgi:tRNA(Ile)-lysidine synthase
LSSSARRPPKNSSPPAPGGSGSSRADEPLAGAWSPVPGAPAPQRAADSLPPAVRRVLRTVERFARAERLFRGRRRLLVAVSGGPDSLACLHLLLALRETFGLELKVAHFDHQLRPGSADDLQFVRDHAAALGLEAITGEGPVREVAARQRRGIEETARLMRYQFLAFAAEKEGCDAVVTGHTADDQAETVLLHLLRGSGVRGMRGMLPAAPIPGAPGRTLLRPLLCIRRDDTAAVCSELGLEPRLDESNRDPAHTRNRIRTELLPVAVRFNPSIADALLGLADSAREAFELLEKRSFEARAAARGPVGAVYDLAALAGLPAESLLLVIEREAAFFHLEPEVNRTRVRNFREVLRRGSGQVAFGDTVVEVSASRVRIGPRLEPVEPIAPVILDVPGSRRVGPWRVDVLTSPLAADPAAPVAALATPALRGALRARSIQPGDTLTWRGLRRKLSDLFINEKIPAWERPGSVVIADAEGPVAVFTASRVFVRDAPGPPDLWVRLAALPRQAAP